MIAPKVPKPQTKATENPISRLALERSTLAAHRYGRDRIQQALFFQRAVGDQATSRLLAQASRPDREMGLKNMAIPREGRGLSRDFSKFPLFSPERVSRAKRSFSPPVARFAGTIQAKLEVGAVDDPLESEADQVALQVMHMPDAQAVALPTAMAKATPAMQRKTEAPQISNLASSPTSSGISAPPSVNEAISSPGQPLDSSTRAFMEPRFGSDFGSVRLHTDGKARNSAADVGALAYTVGQHVVLREQSPSQQLLAHELTHVVQQSSTSGSLVQRDDGHQRSSPPPPEPQPRRPSLDARLKVIEESGGAIGARLDEIIKTGGGMPKPGTKAVILAIIVDAKSPYKGPREIRAVNGKITDKLGDGALVHHATSPEPGSRVLTETKGSPTGKMGGREPSILGPHHESINSHENDAEIKGFEYVIPQLEGVEATLHFKTMSVSYEKGAKELEFKEIPSCSGCIRASFETAGLLAKVELVSHAAPYGASAPHPGVSPRPPRAVDDIDKFLVPDLNEKPITNPQNLEPGTTLPRPGDKVNANMDLTTGKVAPGPGTGAASDAYLRRNNPLKPTTPNDVKGHGGGGSPTPQPTQLSSQMHPTAPTHVATPTHPTPTAPPHVATPTHPTPTAPPHVATPTHPTPTGPPHVATLTHPTTTAVTPQAPVSPSPFTSPAPQARTVSGEFTAKPVGSILAEQGMTHQPDRAVPEGGVPSAGGHLANAVGGFALNLALSQIFGRIIGNNDESRIGAALKRMEPQIQTRIEQEQGLIRQLLQQTNMRQTVYANITFDVIYSFSIDPDPEAPPMIDYQDTILMSVGVTFQELNKENWIRTQVGPLGMVGQDDHHLYTYSIPIAVPAALLAPEIRELHSFLTGIKQKLIAVSGGTAGELVALDRLNSALDATSTVSSSATGSARANLTFEAIDASIRFLQSPARRNPALQSVMGPLWWAGVIFRKLQSRWSVMV